MFFLTERKKDCLLKQEKHRGKKVIVLITLIFFAFVTGSACRLSALALSLSYACFRGQSKLYHTILSTFPCPVERLFLTMTVPRCRKAIMLAVSLGLILLAGISVSGQSTCSIDDDSKFQDDPNLQILEFDVGEGPQTTKVYVEPEITSMYSHSDSLPSSQKVKPAFNGFQCKFVNLSNETVVFSWEESRGGRRHVMRYLEPWSATGTASFPTHNFVMTPRDDEDNILVRLTVKEYPDNIYYYDPYQIANNPQAPDFLSAQHQEMYTYWRQTVLFNEQYRAKTGRSYLANFLRQPPIHFMWPAEYFGQEHWITSKETHFQTVPPEEKLQKITAQGKERSLRHDEPRLLEEYRDMSSPYINMTLRVISVAPRVLEIPNFLSVAEVKHVLDLAHSMDMAKSTTGDSTTGGKETTQLKTRTSKNTWVSREASPIIDTIYRRAADLERIDEALLRYRDREERPDVAGIQPLSEQLQLVHYSVSEEYTYVWSDGWYTLHCSTC